MFISLGHLFGQMMKLYLVECKPIKSGFMKYRIWVSYLHYSQLNISCLFKERYANRLNIEGLQMFSLGKSNAPYTIAAYIKGKKVMKIKN
jgi:hypothetical protein